MSKISPPELDEQRSSDEEPLILDIRPSADFRDDHIDGSHNVPVYADLRNGNRESFDERLEHLDVLTDGRRVVTVCKAGIVARKATRVLEDEGYDAATLSGGIRGWRGYQNESLGYRIRSILSSVLP